MTERDVAAAITRDLEARRRERRRFFAPALVIALLIVGGVLTATGLRGDLWHQPPLQLALQFAVWALCFGALPAIGLGLAFPGPTARLLIVLAAAGATLGATLGAPLTEVAGLGLQCGVLVLLVGLVLLGLAALSGAFAQRRRTSTVLWIAGGIALAALETVTWHCPADGRDHVLVGHLGATLVLLVLAAGLAAVTHARQRRGE